MGFTKDEIRPLDGEVYGTWWLTEPAGAESNFAYDLSFSDDGVSYKVRGHGRTGVAWSRSTG